VIGFLIGVAVGVFAIPLYVSRHDIADLPRIWREEPDRNLRPWFVFVRWFVRRAACVFGFHGDLVEVDRITDECVTCGRRFCRCGWC
jgi:hypothetical protein